MSSRSEVEMVGFRRFKLANCSVDARGLLMCCDMLVVSEVEVRSSCPIPEGSKTGETCFQLIYSPGIASSYVSYCPLSI